jgi:hypothetical protein
VSEAFPETLGFTSDKGGANLPANFGPWLREEMPGVVFAETDDVMSEAVERHGFCIVDDDSPLMPKKPALAITPTP